MSYVLHVYLIVWCLEGKIVALLRTHAGRTDRATIKRLASSNNKAAIHARFTLDSRANSRSISGALHQWERRTITRTQSIDDPERARSSRASSGSLGAVKWEWNACVSAVNNAHWSRKRENMKVWSFGCRWVEYCAYVSKSRGSETTREQ